MMQIELPHSVTYDFDGTASVQDIARSLVSQERLMRDALDVLSECFPNLHIDGIRIVARLVEQQSPLKEVLSAIVVISHEDELQEEVPKLIEALTGQPMPDSIDSLVTVLVMVAAIFGASALYEKVFGKKSLELQAQQGRLEEAAEGYGVPRDRLEPALQKRLGGARRRSVIKSSVDFFAPAKRNGARAITSAAGTVAITEEAIRAVPADIDLASVEPETDQYVAENVIVRLRAADMDKNKRWAATIDGVSDARKPLHLDLTIDTARLFGRVSVRGDVLVTTVRNEAGDYDPSLYYLLRVHDDDAS